MLNSDREVIQSMVDVGDSVDDTDHRPSDCRHDSALIQSYLPLIW